MKKLITLSAMVLSCALVGSPAAFAGEKYWGHDCRIEKVAHKLHLSAEQRVKVKAIALEAKRKLEPIRQQMKALHEKTSQAFIAGDLNGFKQRELLREENNLVDSVLKIRMDERVEISKVLTPAQRTQLVHMMHTWKHEMKNKHHK